MKNIQLGIHELPYDYVTEPKILETLVYPNMRKNYYWSNDFSPQYYIAQAQAGFIAVTDSYEEEELLLPEIQYSYALLDFKDLHISKKVKKLLTTQDLTLEITPELDEVTAHIRASHKHCWLSESYLATLKATQVLKDDFQVLSIGLRNNGSLIAGEIGYIIGNTYTSLSGFSSKENQYRNYGTVQLVLLAQYLEAEGFSFWNLGQPYMTYKLALGAKIYERQDFLKRWFSATL